MNLNMATPMTDQPPSRVWIDWYTDAYGDLCSRGNFHDPANGIEYIRADDVAIAVQALRSAARQVIVDNTWAAGQIEYAIDLLQPDDNRGE